jgi:hypothetical protein
VIALARCSSILFVLASTCTAATTSVHAQARPSIPRLRDIALQPADLPHGYVRFLARVTTNATIARENGVPLSLYTRLGRVTGYEVAFKGKRSTTRSHPLCCVDVQVVRYRTAGGALQAFTLGQQMVSNSYHTSTDFQLMVDSTGSTAVQTFTRRFGAQRQFVYFITTHLRKYLLSTEVHWQPGTSKAIVLATGQHLQALMLQRIPTAATAST